MMFKKVMKLFAVVCAGTLLVCPAFAQPGRGGQGRGGRGRMTPEQWKQMRDKYLTDRLRKAGVDEKQLPVVKAAVEAKVQARQAYREKLSKLATELDGKTKDPFVSDKALLAALADCKKKQQAAEEEYKKVVKEQDAKIIAAVGTMTRVKLFLGGILDNGGVSLPRRGGFGRRGGPRGR